MEDRRKRRSRNIAVAAVVCVAALMAIGMMMWHPWDTGVPAGPESGGEEVAATDDAGAQDTEGDTPVEDMPSGEVPPTELMPDPNFQPGKAVTVDGITVTGPTRENFDSEEAWHATRGQLAHRSVSAAEEGDL